MRRKSQTSEQIRAQLAEAAEGKRHSVISVCRSSDWLIALQRRIIIINNSSIPESISISSVLMSLLSSDRVLDSDNAASHTDGCFSVKYVLRMIETAAEISD